MQGVTATQYLQIINIEKKHWCISPIFDLFVELPLFCVCVCAGCILHPVCLLVMVGVLWFPASNTI